MKIPIDIFVASSLDSYSLHDGSPAFLPLRNRPPQQSNQSIRQLNKHGLATVSITHGSLWFTVFLLAFRV